jgi:hypothetical protein
MKKIEIIKKAIISNEGEIEKLKSKRREVEEARTDELSRMYLKYFGECLVDDDKIEVSDTYVYFKRFDSDYNYHKEIMSISVRPKTWRDEEADSIETSFYSTSTNNEFELNRMILIGNVGRVILDFQDDIIAEYNLIRRSRYKVEISKLNSQIWDLEKKVREMNSEINTIENDALMDQIDKDGIEFKVDEENLYKLPDLDIRFDWNVKYIKKIKVIGKTKSGKSADIELVTVRNVWDEQKGKYELESRAINFQRVRMDKISNLISWNKEIIVS